MPQRRWARQTHLELVLLEVLFGEVLQAALRVRDLALDDELVALAAELDVVAELASLALDLDAVVQKLFVAGRVKDIVAGRDRVVDEEAVGRLGRAGLGGGGLGLSGRSGRAKRDESGRSHRKASKDHRARQSEQGTSRQDHPIEPAESEPSQPSAHALISLASARIAYAPYLQGDIAVKGYRSAKCRCLGEGRERMRQGKRT